MDDQSSRADREANVGAEPVQPVTVYASLRSLAAATLTPLALLAVGVAALSTGGARVVPVLLAVGGAILGVIVLLDVPRRAVFDADGITRICFARRHRIGWDRVVAIERSRPSTTASVRNLTDKGDDRVVSGGLIARGRGRTRWLLTDKVESRMEYDQLSTIAQHPSVRTVLRAPRPHEAAPPTYLYRRRAAGATDR